MTKSIYPYMVLVFFALVVWNNVRFNFSRPAPTVIGKRPFHRWADPRGISLPALFGFMNERLEVPTRDRWDPWIIYTVDENANLWISHRILDQYQDAKMDIERMRNRLNPADELFYLAFELLKQVEPIETTSDAARVGEWPFLRSAIRRGGFPFVVFVGDACVEQHRDGHTLPIFNLCLHLHSKNAFAFATYQTWNLAKHSSEEWQNLTFAYNNHSHPWHYKTAKAVWRGTPTGFLDKDNVNQRWHICQKGRAHKDIMDVGFHVKPPAEQAAMNMTGFFLLHGMPEDFFLNYRAIIDVDGNFWSQRFGTLLCSNSVVLKVEPQWVDYFHFSLEPWKHYIPIKGDLSDLIEQVKFAVSDANEWTVQSIVVHANNWCRHQMVKQQLARDFLDSLDWYAQQLDRGDPNWHKRWSRQKQTLFLEKNKMQLRTTTPLY